MIKNFKKFLIVLIKNIIIKNVINLNRKEVKMKDINKVFEPLDDAMKPIHEYNEKCKELEKKYPFLFK